MKKNSRIQKTPYYFIFNEQIIKVDAEIFSQMSKKFKEIIKTNPEKFEFKEQVSEHTFKAFIASCQLQPFTIPPLYALELLDLSRKWGIPSLEQYTCEVCRTNGIIFRPKEDALGNLLEKINENSETKEDLQAVANILNDLFNDDRLPDVEPEILFRIIILSEKQNLDMKKFIKFVIGLFNTNPESAVLLSLRINFDLLTEKEVDIIFRCSEMHSIHINFFVAAALSSIRYKSFSSISELEKRHQSSINLFAQRMEEEIKKIKNNLNDEHEKKLDEIMDILEEQHRIIEGLTDILTEQAEKLENGPLSSSSLSDQNAIELQEDTKRKMNKFIELVNDVLKERKEAAIGGVHKSVSQVEQKWVDDLTDPDKVLHDTENIINQSDKACQKQEEQINNLSKELVEIKATLCAKIVKDKIRYDKGKRIIENRFLIFNNEGWLPSDQQVHSAESFLNGLEQRIDIECPIRGK